MRRLSVGDHFGEISVIYNCKRSATVVSNKYATIGCLPKSKYKQLLFKYQEINDLFMEKLYTYDDSLKLFKEDRLRQTPYFKHASEESLHHALFGLKHEIYEKGHVFLDEETPVDKFFIIKDGLVDIETTVDNIDFVIESLNRGSLLNYRRFMYGDDFKLQTRCKTKTSLLYITDTFFKELCDTYEDINNAYLKAKSKINNKTEKLIIDYKLPWITVKKQEQKPERRKEKLTSIFKNCAIKILLNNKEKRRPALKELLKRAVRKMKEEEKLKKAENKQKPNKSESDDSTEDSRTKGFDRSQAEFFDTIVEDLETTIKYNNRMLQTIESSLIDIDRSDNIRRPTPSGSKKLPPLKRDSG